MTRTQDNKSSVLLIVVLLGFVALVGNMQQPTGYPVYPGSNCMDNYRSCQTDANTLRTELAEDNPTIPHDFIDDEINELQQGCQRAYDACVSENTFTYGSPERSLETHRTYEERTVKTPRNWW